MTKIVIGAGAVIALALGIYGFGYVRTVATNVKDAAEAAIPTQLKLDRAEDMLKNELHPKINKLKEVVAHAEYDVEKAEAAKKETVAQLTTKRGQMLARHGDLKDNPTKESFQIKDVSYSRAQVESDLHNRLTGVKTLEAKLASQEKTSAAKAKAHSANKDRLAAYLKAEEQLKAQIDQLRASLEAVEAQEDIAENVESDDSELKALEALIGKIDEDVAVRTKVADAATAGDDSTTEIPVGDAKDDNAINAVDAYLNNSSKKQEPVVNNASSEIPIE
jgi:chromosome segregation ATPase